MGDLGSKVDDRYREDASEWFVKLQSPKAEPSPEQLQQWERWISVPEHRKAYDAIEDTWRKVGALHRPRSSINSNRDTDNYDGSISVAHWRKTNSPFRLSRRRWLARIAQIRALMLFAATVLAAAIRFAWASGMPWWPVALTVTV